MTAVDHAYEGLADEVPAGTELTLVNESRSEVHEYLAAAAEAEGGPPDVAGGPPHIAAGMFAELIVT